MAIKKDIIFENGLECKGAYIRIENITGDKNNIHITVTISKDRNYANTRTFISQRGYMFTPDNSATAKNIFEQAYDYIKALPEFEGAVDVTNDPVKEEVVPVEPVTIPEEVSEEAPVK